MNWTLIEYVKNTTQTDKVRGYATIVNEENPGCTYKLKMIRNKWNKHYLVIPAMYVNEQFIPTFHHADLNDEDLSRLRDECLNNKAKENKSASELPF